MKSITDDRQDEDLSEGGSPGRWLWETMNFDRKVVFRGDKRLIYNLPLNMRRLAFTWPTVRHPSLKLRSEQSMSVHLHASGRKAGRVRVGGSGGRLQNNVGQDSVPFPLEGELLDQVSRVSNLQNCFGTVD